MQAWQFPTFQGAWGTDYVPNLSRDSVILNCESWPIDRLGQATKPTHRLKLNQLTRSPCQLHCSMWHIVCACMYVRRPKLSLYKHLSLSIWHYIYYSEAVQSCWASNLHTAPSYSVGVGQQRASPGGGCGPFHVLMGGHESLFHPPVSTLS